MKIIKPGYIILNPNLENPDEVRDIYKRIESAGRTCYKSEDKITETSAEKFVRAMVKNGHEAMLEHASMSVRFIVDRGVSHELVRHRIASFAQESTRYCNYSKEKFGEDITVIEPVFYNGLSENVKQTIRNAADGYEDVEIYFFDKIGELGERYSRWYSACRVCENAYLRMIKTGASPEEARSVLPNSLKTEVVVTADMREWRNILKLRAAGERGKPHPQMMEVMVPLLTEMKTKLPALFWDIWQDDDDLIKTKQEIVKKIAEFEKIEKENKYGNSNGF